MESIVGNFTEDAELLQGQAEVYKHTLAYADSLLLRSAVELRIADIIHAHGQPMSLSQIASKIKSPSINMTNLAYVMRMLARKKIFSVEYVQSSSNNHETEILYGLTATSKWLVHDHELSLALLVLTFTDPRLAIPFYQISHSIKEGEVPFMKNHGESFYKMASINPEFNKMFNDGMASCSKPTIYYVIKKCKDELFSKLEGTLVDVGGGIGEFVSKIVEACPHIKGINFDMPHVIATAPQYPGVTHVGGDILKEIPSADNVTIKTVLLDWSDEHCITILKNCRKAISEKKGKVIIVDIIVYPDRYELFDDEAISGDVLERVIIGGKCRTESEWIQVSKKAGFTDINFIPLQDFMRSIIVLNY